MGRWDEHLKETAKVFTKVRQLCEKIEALEDQSANTHELMDEWWRIYKLAIRVRMPTFQGHIAGLLEDMVAFLKAIEAA